MVRMFKSYALAGVAALALPAIAQEAPAQAARAEQAQSAVTATSSQIVVRDGNTGQLRAASPEEANSLREQHSKGRLRAAPQSTLPRSHASGARGAHLGFVSCLGAWGSIWVCVSGTSGVLRCPVLA